METDDGVMFVCGRREDFCIWNMVWQLVAAKYRMAVGFCFLFSLFLVCEIEDKGQWWGYWMSFRYLFALLSNLKKSEASGVVRPVRVVLFLSGWYLRASCR